MWAIPARAPCWSTGGRVLDATGYIGRLAGSNGSVTVSSGTWANSIALYVGNTGTGTLLVNGGYVSNTTGNIGSIAGSNGSVTVSSGTWVNSGGVNVATSGTGTLLVNGGATVSSGTWASSSSLLVGDAGTGTLLVSGGRVSNTTGIIGSAASSSGSATVSGGTWANSGTLVVGASGTGALLISGGYTSAGSSVIGSATTAVGSVTVSGGTLAISGSFTVGQLGSGAHLTIQTGGAVSCDTAYIGSGTSSGTAPGRDNVVMVTGSDSVWMISGSLVVGDYGSNNTLTVEDDALVKVGDASGETVVVSAHTGTGNFLRLDGGYIALFGDQTSYVTNTLLPASVIQVWSGSSWTLATSGNLQFAYYATDGAALTASGYSGLEGYTILNAVPEP